MDGCLAKERTERILHEEAGKNETRQEKLNERGDWFDRMFLKKLMVSDLLIESGIPKKNFLLKAKN
jgi:hypothetical protein